MKPGIARTALLGAATFLALACTQPAARGENSAGPEDPNARAREKMVAETIEARGVRDAKVLAAMRKVPRHLFLPRAADPETAYGDHPLPIGEGQTVSQPYIVALMTELATLEGGEKVLEVGTGSGYQAAVLAEIAGEVYSIEIIDSLARKATDRLEGMGYKNIHVRAGDGYRGWPDEAPFDAILVTAAPPRIPGPLKEQLKPGGRLVIPVGDAFQELQVVTRSNEGFATRGVAPVVFVPMTGEVQEKR